MRKIVVSLAAILLVSVLALAALVAAAPQSTTRKILVIVADERTFEIPVGHSERLHAFIDRHLSTT